MDLLRPLDSEFVEAENEDQHVSMAIGSIAIFEAPAPSYEEFVRAIEARLPLVPRYRQRVRSAPLRIGPPMWVDDPHFDIRFHIRETALPSPGGDAELAHLMARVMSQRLDRDRPLWEDWLVTGLADQRWAVISKVHHCMVDGISGADLYRVMFDAGASDEAAATLERPVQETSTLALATRAAVDTMLLPARTARALANMVLRPVPALHDGIGTARAMWKLLSAAGPARRSSLNGPIGQQRRYTWVSVQLDDIRAIKRAMNGTVNDAVLAAITSGFRSLLLARGEEPLPHMVPSLVPVSMRGPGEANVYDNRVSAMIVDLPVEMDDPAAQMLALRDHIGALKKAGESAAGQAVISLAAYVPYAIYSLTRLWFRLAQREIVTVTTNVPGPRQTLFCLGRPLVEILPYVPIASTLRVGVAIFSYRDRVTFGITGDYDSTPDLEVLAHGIEDGVKALLKEVS